MCERINGLKDGVANLSDAIEVVREASILNKAARAEFALGVALQLLHEMVEFMEFQEKKIKEMAVNLVVVDGVSKTALADLERIKSIGVIKNG